MMMMMMVLFVLVVVVGSDEGSVYSYLAVNTVIFLFALVVFFFSLFLSRFSVRFGASSTS